MSYIFDALKKLEKERQQSTLPDLLAVQDAMAQVQKRRRLWPYLILIALLLNAGILVWWLVPWQSKKPVVVQSRSVKQLESEASRSSSPGSVETVSPGVRTSPIQKQEAKTGKIIQQNQPERAETNLKKKVQSEPKKPAESGVSQEVSASSEPEPVNDIPAPVANKIYSMGELPSSIQQNLPTFKVSVFIYSDNPASRMVKINDQMLQEGQYLAEGLKLEEITPDEVIFSYQNYRFRVGLK